MGALETTRMSAKGDVVIPEGVRDRLNLEPGVEFAVLNEGDAVILKMLHPPSIRKFETLVRDTSSGDKALRRASGYAGIEVLSPRQFLGHYFR